jgi:hypothetical protein
MQDAAIPRLISQIANIDVGLNAFRAWLPAHGFKLVVPPPTSGAAAFASAWRQGQPQVVSHKGATAALALLLAAESEFVKLHDASAVGACGRCHGLGWFVTNSAAVELCRHPERAKILVG